MIRELDPENLIGKHVFAEYAHRGRTTIVKGLVLNVNRWGRLKLKLTGNGREFDGKTIVSLPAELQTRYGVIRTAERQGDPPDLGKWRD